MVRSEVMAEEERWQAYLVPGSDVVLKNKQGFTDVEEWRKAEYAMTLREEARIRTGDVIIPGGWGSDTVRGLHYVLTRGMYEWAGQYRTTPLTKISSRTTGPDAGADVSTTFLDYRLIPDTIDKLGRRVRDIDLAGMDTISDVAEVMAQAFTALTVAHPFRDQNGRVTRLYLARLAEASELRLALSDMPRGLWAQMGIEQVHGDRDFARRTLEEHLQPGEVSYGAPAFEKMGLEAGEVPRPKVMGSA